MDFTSELTTLTAALCHPPIGVGVDVVDISDFERLPFELHQPFYQRCFSPSEISYCRQRPRPAQHFAARFAAKEAAVKALGGHIQLAYWQTEVHRADDGTPTLKFWNQARDAALAELADIEALVSLTHADGVAAAVVIAYRKDTLGG